jgi:hypothetical protein
VLDKSRSILTRLFQAAPEQRASPLEHLSYALQQYFNVPEDMPDAFVQAFARLDSSEHQREECKPETRSQTPVMATQR